MQSAMWKIYSTLIGAVTTMAAQKVVEKSWTLVTGEEPPEPGDPDTPLHTAITWSIATVIGVGAVQLMTTRAVLRRKRAAVGDDDAPVKGLFIKV